MRIREQGRPQSVQTPQSPVATQVALRNTQKPAAEQAPSSTSFSRSTTAAEDLRPAAHTTGTSTVARVTTGRSLPMSKGATAIPDRATFEKLARRDDVPGQLGAREVKFLMTGVDGPNPQVYFINTNNIVYHWDFMTGGLGKPITLEEFNAQTYFTDHRKNLAGSIIARDNFEGPRGQKGLYTMEFWPTDPVKARHVAIAFKAIKKAMPFAAKNLAYHPAGETQQALANQEKSQLSRLRVKTVTTEALFKGVNYSAMNMGEGYGVLRVVDPANPSERPPSVRDVVIFKNTPNDLSHVGGIITEAPQTPLSHINLKAKQNDTPNAYIKDAANDPRIAPFLGKLVHYKVTPDGFTIEEATKAQADAWLEKVRPQQTTKLPRNLNVKKLVTLEDLAHKDLSSVGAKAANVAELRRILPPGMVPNGFAVPFHFYDSFMKHNGLYDEATRMMADPRFKEDPAVREEMLTAFRRKIRRAEVPPDISAMLKAKQAEFPADQPLRCRSSTNNEDLEGFNGAGLYDSYTHRPDEGALENTIKQVWSSLWNYRAYEEREFYRVDHLTAAMGVLVHPNFDDETANGVAVTKNIYDPNWKGFYVNVQVGEELVTNPEGGATPDEFLISAIGPHGEFETQYVKHSNQVEQGKTILTEAQARELTSVMERIQAHFQRVYGKEQDKSFAMDIEFKIGKDGKLVVKQARPYVD
ncbi:MAG: PEP/pyruvate-binding domain-containing protein [Myxococcota bacterium]